jgi:hypothetical protein
MSNATPMSSRLEAYYATRAAPSRARLACPPWKRWRSRTAATAQKVAQHEAAEHTAQREAAYKAGKS